MLDLKRSTGEVLCISVYEHNRASSSMRKVCDKLPARARVCTCTCMYVCMYLCMYVCVCLYVCIYVCVYVYICMYVYMYVYVCMLVCTYVNEFGQLCQLYSKR